MINLQHQQQAITEYMLRKMPRAVVHGDRYNRAQALATWAVEQYGTDILMDAQRMFVFATKHAYDPRLPGNESIQTLPPMRTAGSVHSIDALRARVLQLNAHHREQLQVLLELEPKLIQLISNLQTRIDARILSEEPRTSYTRLTTNMKNLTKELAQIARRVERLRAKLAHMEA